MPRQLPEFYFRGASQRATEIFHILDRQWREEFEATSSPIDFAVRGPGAIWRIIVSEYPGLDMADRRDLTREVMTVIFDHADFCGTEAEGSA
jgi:hypothetical protein